MTTSTHNAATIFYHNRNEVTVVSGKAKGKGVVTGKHGGVEHLMIDLTTTFFTNST